MQVSEKIILLHKLQFIYFLIVALANSSDIPKQIFLCIIANDKKVKELIN
jgi:hypothetical protein